MTVDPKNNSQKDLNTNLKNPVIRLIFSGYVPYAWNILQNSSDDPVRMVYTEM